MGKLLLAHRLRTARAPGRGAVVDGALPVRVCAMGVGGGRHLRRRRGHGALAHALSSVRQALLAHDLAHGRN